ncbi:unnamed protein product [Lathyrus sativus]|nr:unnamed protein product [Lathyrus sativus]
MALRKLFTKRLLEGAKTTPSLQQTIVSPNTSKTNFHREYLSSPDSINRGVFRRFLPRRSVHHSDTAKLPEYLSLPVGEKLREKLNGINNITGTGDRLNLGDLSFPKFTAQETVTGSEITVEDAKKILRASQMEKVKAKLRDIPENTICYSEFLRVCFESSQNHDQGTEFAKILDESGNVIVLGNIVFLRPEQVAKSIESLLHQSIASPNDPRRKELENMEKQKAIIDDKAKAQVQTELYCGLGFLAIQTLGFMRLTFWELSWDVMEPICFFVTSLHFAMAYMFFIRTSTEPTFQGYFHRRFTVKQERLMKKYNFNAHRYSELCKACYPSNHGGAKAESFSPPINNAAGETVLRALYH